MRGERTDGEEAGALSSLIALSGAAAVMAGAFGAHGADGPAAEWLKTGAQYQMVHVVAALIAVTVLRARTAGWLFLGGGWTFAGTLYLMALGGPRMLGALTPIGGLALIAGWLALAYRLRRLGRRSVLSEEQDQS